MTTSGPNAGGTFASDNAVGTTPWVNPGNAVSSNASYAVNTSGGGDGEYLKITNFGFSIPAGVIINGIQFDVVRKAGSTNVTDNIVKTVQGGTVGGNNNAGGGAWGTSPEFPFYGGPADLWGRSWLYSDINASTFGIVYSPHFAAADTAFIDFISCTITYTSITIAATGTLIETTTSVTRESHIVAGGRTLILTVTGDTWVASGGTFDGQRQNIINGIDSAQAEANGWDAEVKAKIGVSDVVRTSSTVVTITLDAEAAYNITVQETVTAAVPATALSAGSAIVASPTFRVVPDINRITHLGGLGISREPPPPRNMGDVRAGAVPAHWKDVRPR